MKARLASISIALGAALSASAAVAHSVGWSIASDAQAVVVQFNYGGSDPMAFAEVTVTAPDGRVFQKGRADRNGHFAFVVPADAQTDAIWTIGVRDEEGHAIQAQVTPASPADAASAGRLSGHIIGWFALASVLTSVGLAGALLEQRSRRTAASRKHPQPG